MADEFGGIPVDEPQTDEFGGVAFEEPEAKPSFAPKGPPTRADLAMRQLGADKSDPFSPFVSLGPDIKATTLPGQLVAAPYNVGKGIVEGLESRGGLALAPLGVGGKLVQAGIGARFGVPAIKEGLRRVYTGTALKDPQEAIEGALQALSGGVLTGGAVKEGVEGFKPKETPTPEPISEQAPPAAPTGEAQPSAAPGGESVEKPADTGSTPQPVVEPATPTTPTQEETVTPPVTETGPGTIGEAEMGAAGIKEIPETGSGGEIYAVSQSGREARAKAGQVEPVQPGTGITPEQANARGIQMLNQGFDAPKALETFERTGAISPDDAMAIGAYGERLAADARKKELLGTNSEEYQAAFRKLSDWDKRSKGLATAAHKMMVAHQGFTDLDTGSFTSLQRAWADATGKEFTPKQKTTAETIANNSAQSTESAGQAIGDFIKHTDEAVSRSTPEQRAIDAANKTVREAAVMVADAETKARVAQQARDTAVDNLRKVPEQAAATATADAARAEAIKAAKADNEDRVKEASQNKELADIELKRTQKALDAATDRARRAAIDAAKKESRERIANADMLKKVWNHIKTKYLSKGINDPGVVFKGTATDLGMTADRVREILSKPEGSRRLMVDMYKKLSDQRRIVQAAKVWLAEQQRPGIERFISKIPRVFFIDKIFGHGTALHVTHSATQAFNPYVANIWWRSFARQWPFAYKPGYAEAIIRDTMNDKNYYPARQFGLDNDFTSASGDYQAATSKFKGVMRTLAGNKGSDGLKVLRQQMFNNFWDEMEPTQKTGAAGRDLALKINHATGSMGATTKVPSTLQWLMFAPKLEGSRWGYTFGDSIKDGMTLARWNEATPEERLSAKRDMKQKAAIAGTYLALLTVNQGLLKASDSKQNVNFFDPTKSDWLSFKVGGHNVGLIGPMIGEIRFLSNVAKTAFEERTRSQARRTRKEDLEKNVVDYARGKASPIAGFGIDTLAQSDFQGRPLPWSDDRVPLYMRRRGQDRYTYPEYAEQFLPIPFEETAREAWAEQGVDEPTIQKWLKVLSVGAGSLTGARISKDYQMEK